VLGGPADRRSDAEHLTNRRDESVVDSAERLLGATEIQLLEQRPVLVEMRGAPVVVRQRLPMPFGPMGIADPNIFDPLQVSALHFDGNRQPGNPCARFDPVPVAPVAHGVLGIVEQDEFIARVDEIEIALPWNVIGLHQCDRFVTIALRNSLSHG
jgi:hypothetical protein